MEDYLKIKVENLTIKKEEPKLATGLGSVCLVSGEDNYPGFSIGTTTQGVFAGIALNDTKAGNLITIHTKGIFEI